MLFLFAFHLLFQSKYIQIKKIIIAYASCHVATHYFITFYTAHKLTSVITVE